MPRLTNQRYYKQHIWLSVVNREYPPLFTVLSSVERAALFAFYQPHQVTSESELIAHRVNVTKAQPNLPARAGKIYSRLQSSFESADQQSGGDLERFEQIIRSRRHRDSVTTFGPAGKQRHITVRAVRRPGPDLHKLSKAILALAMEQVMQEQAAKDAHADDVSAHLAA